MRRRDFIAVLGGAAAWPLAARAQSSDRMRRIGVLIPYAESDVQSQAQRAAFHEGLQQLGWTIGRNVTIDYRWTGGDFSRIGPLAKELVELQPDAILCRSTPTTAALMRETRTIPIVFVMVSDPVGDRIVASIARPGSNATGFTNVESSLGSKWLGLLKEIVPRVTRVAVMFNPNTAGGAGGSYYMRLVEDAAAQISVKPIATPIQDATSIEPVIDKFAREPNGCLLVLPDVTTIVHSKLIVAMAARYSLPAVYPYRQFATDGGLVAYGVEIGDLYRRAASYIDRILRGAKPEDLAVQLPTKFDLVINLKTAKALGLEVPAKLLFTADEVIE